MVLETSGTNITWNQCSGKQLQLGEEAGIDKNGQFPELKGPDYQCYHYDIYLGIENKAEVWIS